MEHTSQTPTVQETTATEPTMAESICTGSVFDCLTNHGIEAVTDLWPELAAYEETLQSILNAERCRAAHERAAEREEQIVESLMATLAAQVS